MIVYVKGTNENITLYAKNKPIEFKKDLTNCIGLVARVGMAGQSLRIQCKTVAQKNSALTKREIGTKLVTFSELFTMQPKPILEKPKEKEHITRGIIF